jgi:hypothetical protein
VRSGWGLRFYRGCKIFYKSKKLRVKLYEFLGVFFLPSPKTWGVKCMRSEGS